MNPRRTSKPANSATEPESSRVPRDAGSILGLQASVTVRTALRATFLSPTMLSLLALGAVSTFMSISYISNVIAGYNSPYMLSLYYGTYGTEGLSPAFIIMQWLHMYAVALTPLLLLVSVPLGYGISNVVAEDMGAMPENLLLSRPLVRWRYLLLNFSIRSAIIIAVAFVAPFLLAYPSAVGALESSGGSYIVTRMPLDEWTQLAWGTPLMEVLLLYSFTFLVISAIALAVSTVWRRGAVTMPVMLVVVGVGPIISMIIYFFATFGGVAGSGLPWVFHLLSPFRLFTGELSLSYSFTNILIPAATWCIFLLLLSLAMYCRIQPRI